MAIAISGTKTVTKDSHPGLTAATLTTIMATPVENLTLAQLHHINDALARVSGGHAKAAVTVGSILL